MASILKTFTHVLLDTLKAFISRFFPLGTVSLIYYVPFFLLDRYYWNNEPIYEMLIEKLTYPVYLTFDVIFSSFMVLFFFWYLIALTMILIAFDKQERLNPFAAYKKAYKKWLAYLILFWTILYRGFLRLLLLVVPGFIYYVKTSLAGLIFLCEAEGREAAILKSMDILKGKVSYYLDHLLYIALILFVFSYPYIAFLERFYVVNFLNQRKLFAAFLDYSQTGIVILATLFFYVFYYYLYHHLMSIYKGARNDTISSG